MLTEEKLRIEEVLSREGKYVGPTAGTSMLPMLKTGRDTVVIRPRPARLGPLDVALYKRGEEYVLHRVIAVLEKGYLIRGDNCLSDERVAEADILGVLTEFFRGDEHILCTNEKYLRYAKRRVKLYPLRRFFGRGKARVKSALKKLLPRGGKRRARRGK